MFLCLICFYGVQQDRMKKGDKKVVLQKTKFHFPYKKNIVSKNYLSASACVDKYFSSRGHFRAIALHFLLFPFIDISPYCNLLAYSEQVLAFRCLEDSCIS